MLLSNICFNLRCIFGQHSMRNNKVLKFGIRCKMGDISFVDNVNNDLLCMFDLYALEWYERFFFRYFDVSSFSCGTICAERKLRKKNEHVHVHERNKREKEKSIKNICIK